MEDVRQQRSLGAFETPVNGRSASLPSLGAALVVDPGVGSFTERGIFGFNSMDVRSRSFNLIRSKLIRLKATRGWRTFGIVSATPHVGKSFIAANVAASLSRDPRNTTHLLDLDLRRASLSDLLGLSEEVGLLEYLSNEERVTAPPTYSFAGQSLVIYPTRRALVHSAELLAGKRAQRLFEQMRTSSSDNIFLVDLPPIFANDDAQTCIAAMDGYILVTEEGKTTIKQTEETVRVLGQDRLAGVILNKYRGGVVSEGYGMEKYYAEGYGAAPEELPVGD